MLKCKQITELVSLSQEQKLTLKQRVNVASSFNALFSLQSL